MDDDFPDRFRNEVPKRLSELFYAAAFAEQGWEALEREPGFDFAYRWEDRRVLVEVTTPNAPSATCYQTEEIDGRTHFSGDETTLNATLLRLTGGFFSKAKLFKGLIEKNPSLEDDYKIIALSGFDIGQEMPFPPSASGAVPDFIRGFLPIGQMFVQFPLGADSDDLPTQSGYHVSAEIYKDPLRSVARTAFLDEQFAHVDAITYTPLNMLRLWRASKQVGVLHNPCSSNASGSPRLGMGNEFWVTLSEDSFVLTRETEELE